jgi:5-methylthioadenosine/S-adenosylhomocysteine deaminase
MQVIDQLLCARWIIPVEPRDVILEHHAIAIQDGRILDILPIDMAEARYQADRVLQLDTHALMPGLVNTHTHAAMSLFRGLADDMPLMQWLNEHIWPAEKRWVSEEFVAAGSRLAIAEMIRSGTTCFNDMYFFPDAMARTASHTGIRAVAGLITIDFPTIWARDADEYIEKGLAVHDEFRDDPLIHTAFAPHAPYTVSDQPLQRLQVLSNELDIPIHMHVHETRDEIEHSMANHGKRPIQRLHDLGLLGPSLVAVHMTQVADDEIELLARQGVHVVHCPESNMKLASGFSPVKQLLDHDINVALGTDGASSNNDQDMFGEMQTAALLAKAISGDASALPAMQALEMATINGARALGIDDITGSLAAGKSADIVAVDLDDIEHAPLFHVASQLVYTGSRQSVTDVWVNGRQLLREGQLTSLDRRAILEQARDWKNRITID